MVTKQYLYVTTFSAYVVHSDLKANIRKSDSPATSFSISHLEVRFPRHDSFFEICSQFWRCLNMSLCSVLCGKKTRGFNILQHLKVLCSFTLTTESLKISFQNIFHEKWRVFGRHLRQLHSYIAEFVKSSGSISCTLPAPRVQTKNWTALPIL